MKRMTSRAMILGLSALLGLGALSACSPSSSGSGDSNGLSSGGAKTTVTFRLWDDQAAKAYKDSFAEFTKQNPDITVDVQTVAWADYWDKLTTDIASDTGADIYWMNSSSYGLYADNGNLLDISDKVGTGDGDWVKSVTDLYTRDGKLWGVPQLWDSIALYYNKDMLAAASIDPEQLSWDPAGSGDTFLPAAQKLTLDEAGKSAADAGFDPTKIKQYGFNASLDLQAIWVDFIASNGGHLQKGDDFDFDTPQGVAAIQYVVDLINKQHVSPSAADTNDNGDFCLEQFAGGKMALFQSGPYNLKNIKDKASGINWGIAPMLTGPEGRVGVVHGVSAVGNAKSKNLDATIKVLTWMGTAAGQKPLATQGVAFPGVISAQDDFVKYWADQGVDVAPFLASSQGTTTMAPVGPRAAAGLDALTPTLKEVFLGRTPVADGLKKAQTDANEAIKG